MELRLLLAVAVGVAPDGVRRDAHARRRLALYSGCVAAFAAAQATVLVVRTLQALMIREAVADGT